jgi:hypothetical protein
VNGIRPFQLHMYVIASKCSRNQFVAEKYATIQSFKLRFLQIISFVQLYNSASDWKGVGSFRGSHFVKAFSVASLNHQSWFQLREKVKVRVKSGGCKWCYSVVTLFVATKKIPDQNRPVCWSIVVKEKINVGFPFSWQLSLTAPLRRRRMSISIYLLTVAIPVNNTS